MIALSATVTILYIIFRCSQKACQKSLLVAMDKNINGFFRFKIFIFDSHVLRKLRDKNATSKVLNKMQKKRVITKIDK